MSCKTYSGGIIPSPKELQDECRFLGFRWVKSEDNSTCQMYGLEEAEDLGPYTYHPWSPSRTELHKTAIKVRVPPNIREASHSLV